MKNRASKSNARRFASRRLFFRGKRAKVVSAWDYSVVPSHHAMDVTRRFAMATDVMAVGAATALTMALSQKPSRS
ncbi:MAG: hypothetical protein ISQ09_11555 [Rubripirellula sp.]|nr:hypothetical protein [Rubripirellula sp.]